MTGLALAAPIAAGVLVGSCGGGGAKVPWLRLSFAARVYPAQNYFLVVLTVKPMPLGVEQEWSNRHGKKKWTGERVAKGP